MAKKILRILQMCELSAECSIVGIVKIIILKRCKKTRRVYTLIRKNVTVFVSLYLPTSNKLEAGRRAVNGNITHPLRSDKFSPVEMTSLIYFEFQQH